MLVLVACEYSGRVREAFRKRGHDAWSCDLLETDIPGQHIVGDVRKVLGYNTWDLIIAHPPCTYLANAGVRHLHENVHSRNGKVAAVSGKLRWVCMKQAAAFFRLFLEIYCPRVAIENPIPHGYAVTEIGRKYDQIIQPWQFGHGETKATCLWLKGLPPLTPTNIVAGREHRVHKMPPRPDRQKLRSLTYQGIADAMAEQWGGQC